MWNMSKNQASSDNLFRPSWNCPTQSQKNRCPRPTIRMTHQFGSLTHHEKYVSLEVACSIKNHKPWECKNLMQVSFKWLLEPHEIGVWHLQRAKTILYSWDGKSKKLDPPTTPISSVPSIYVYVYAYAYVYVFVYVYMRLYVHLKFAFVYAYVYVYV